MKYRQLGKTGIKISEIGFGAWGIGGVSTGASSYGETDDNESKRALRRAYELGVTFYDTSDVYGYGHSETLIGEELHGVRDKIVIASKVGFLEHKGPLDLSSQHIKKSIEESLKRLRTDYLDLYQLHSPPINLIEKDESIISTLQLLKRQGKIRAYGISLALPNDGEKAIKLGFESVQVNFNLLDMRAIENGLFDLCVKNEVGLIARTPLCFGFLTGKYNAATQFALNDHRSTWSVEQRKCWANAYKLFLKAIMAKEKQTAVDIALKYCLSYQAVSTVIPGMLHPSEVEEDVVASALKPFTEQELHELEQIYRQNTFFLGKNTYVIEDKVE